MRTEKAQKQLESVVEAFRSGHIGQVIKRTVIPPLDVPCAKWSLCNRVIVSLSGTDDARGYRQWKEVRRYVKKGSKGIYILVPWIAKQKKEDDQHREQDEKRVLRGFISRAVFAYEDTEGGPLDRPSLDPPELPPLFEVAQHFGVKVKYQAHQSDAYGHFSPQRKQIILETHDAKTFWHELGHAAQLRVKGALKQAQDPKQEAVAELTATVIGGLYGSDWSGNCWRYLKGYSTNPLGLCLSVLSEVEQVLDEILGLNATPALELA